MARRRHLNEHDIACALVRVANGEARKVIAIDLGVSDSTLSLAINRKRAYAHRPLLVHPNVAMRCGEGT